MTTDIEYALMAGASYIDTHDPINRFPIPNSSGWSEILNSHRSLSDSGFEAVAFKRGEGTDTEIVISFAGTNPTNVFDPDNAANVNLATGYWSDQLLQAAEYYLQIKAANPPGTKITLTGPSLGGGLAALVGVFFGVSAHTFDQAPFAASAKDTSNNATNLKNYLNAKLDANGNRLYSDADLSGLTNFLQLRAANGGIPNSGLVSTIRVDGEFTSSFPVGLYDPIGTPATVLAHGPYFSPSLDMHSQSLLAAFLQSGQSAAGGSNPQQTLSAVTKKLTSLLEMIFAKNLFEHDTDPNTTDENLLEHLEHLEHLVRHEAGMQGSFAADYFENYLLQSTFTDTERQLIQSVLPYLRDWYVQAGSAGLATTDILNRGAFMLGGTGSDALVGGSKTDLLVGNAGNDVLMGGQGNDMLLGGKGNDTYVFQSGDGLDTILDSDGQGSLLYDGVTLAGGAQWGDARVHRDAGGHLYVDVGASRLLIDGNIVIEGQQAGNDTVTSGGDNDVIATKSIAVFAYSAWARGQFFTELRAMNNSNWRVAA